MRRAPAIIGSAIFLVIAPGTLAVYVPWYLTQWHFDPALFPVARVIGGILIAAGLPILPIHSPVSRCKVSVRRLP